jgi:hypothetical protein
VEIIPYSLRCECERDHDDDDEASHSRMCNRRKDAERKDSPADCALTTLSFYLFFFFYSIYFCFLRSLPPAPAVADENTTYYRLALLFHISILIISLTTIFYANIFVPLPPSPSSPSSSTTFFHYCYYFSLSLYLLLFFRSVFYFAPVSILACIIFQRVYCHQRTRHHRPSRISLIFQCRDTRISRLWALMGAPS